MKMVKTKNNSSKSCYVDNDDHLTDELTLPCWSYVVLLTLQQHSLSAPGSGSTRRPICVHLLFTAL